MATTFRYGFALLLLSLVAACSSDQAAEPQKPAPVNARPVANAGPDQQVLEGATVALDGSLSADADGTIVTYEWVQLGGPAVTLTGADTVAPSFTAPAVDADTALTFQLRVIDDDNGTDLDRVVITVRDQATSNLAPTANAGPDQTEVAEGAVVALDGTASTDSDGTIVAYAWTQSGGPTVALTGADTATPTFTAPDGNADETFAFTLTVTDNGGLQGSDTVQVTVRDQVPVTITANEPAGVTEGAIASFTVTVDAARPGAVVVRYATEDLTAKAGSDYEGVEDSVTIPPGETSATIEVQTTDDVIDELAETFRVELLGVPGAGTTPTTRATGTILDNDADLLRVGSAKRSVAPSSKHIQGVVEDRPYAGIDEGEPAAGMKTQRFGLGGNGLSDPDNSVPSTDPHIGNGWAKGNYRGQEGDGTLHSTYVRALVIEEPSGETVAFVTIDAIGAGNIIQKHLKAAVTAATGIPADNILFGQTHSHGAADLQGLWGGVPATWLDCDSSKQALDGCGEDGWSKGLYQLAAEAVKEALDQRVPASLKVATGMRNLNGTRTNPTTPTTNTDKAMTVLQAREAGNEDRVVGTLLQYAAHPTTVDDRYVHADYVLAAMIDLETEGGTALYYNGPIADASKGGSWQAACSAGDSGGYCSARGYGRELARQAKSLLETAATDVAPALNVRHATNVMLPVTNPAFFAAGVARMFNRYYNFVETPVDDVPQVAMLRNELPQVVPFATTTVSRVTLGNPATQAGLEIATIPGEARNSLGQLIRYLAYKDQSATKPMMLLGLTHNSFGYIIPEDEFGGALHSGEVYEEVVSLGPLTAPLLRLQAYFPLFDAAPEDYAPQYVTACQATPDSNACMLEILKWRYLDGPYGGAGALQTVVDTLAEGCHDAFPIKEVCAITDALAEAVGGGVPPGGGGGDGGDGALLPAAADALLRGCDILDPSHCLYPFPNDHFTVPAAAGTPQSRESDGTGRRINFSIAAMPRNSAGKPIDPSEWNRNDGYSPGQMIVTYVPDIGTVKDGSGKPFGPIVGAVPLSDLSQYDDPETSIVVLDTGPIDAPYPTPVRHLIWAEIDLNAGKLLPGIADDIPTTSPNGKRAPVIIRPAKNFDESHRYVVVLRKLVDESGSPIAAGPAFRTCRDKLATQLPPVQERCDALETSVFPALEKAGIPRDGSLYLAWDFTTASAKNNVARLVAIRDDAFRNYLNEPADAPNPGEPGYPAGDAPQYAISSIEDFASGKTVRRIKGTITVPSYVVPADPSPLDGQKEARDRLKAIADQCQSMTGGNCGVPGVGDAGDGADLAASGSLPPNRLFYQPDETAANACNYQYPDEAQAALRSACLEQARYGDGLPDRNPAGDLTFTFTCNIPRSAVNGAADMDEATAADIRPVRPTLYGHGLLGGQGEGDSQASDFGNIYGLMNCAADWFGFASGDLPNVASVLVDLSNFPVVPDGSQQGMLNFMFLARLLTHPQGLASDPNFQVAGKSVFDRREVFYHGNSQGGILGGVIVAASKDINRGVLGVLGMNYSTLLTRSTDFTLYSVPLYLSYHDDLDRNLNFSLMQMLWDRSENNGYAHHIADNSAMGGPDNAVLLHPAFGDHQVTMWSADVMARTIGAPVDRRRVSTTPDRHPDNVEFFALEPLDYANPAHAAGSGLVYWDEPWNSQVSGTCDNNATAPPPLGNVPPGDAAGDDPHECPRRDSQARCQMSHFLLRESAAQGDSTARLIDWTVAEFGSDSAAGCPAVVLTGAPLDNPGPGEPEEPASSGGLLGVLGEFTAQFNEAMMAFVAGDPEGAATEGQQAFEELGGNLSSLPGGADPARPAQTVVGLADDPSQALRANREVEAVVITGDRLPGWSAPAAQGVPKPYPSGAGPFYQTAGEACGELPFGEEQCNEYFRDGLDTYGPRGDQIWTDPIRNAYNGYYLYPLGWMPGQPSVAGGVPVNEIAAFRWDPQQQAFIEIPVQVDERKPYYLANANSGFSFYSGTDEELSYVWDEESWGMTAGECSKEYDPNGWDVNPANPDRRNTGISQAIGDPVAGLDDDDELVFMAQDAGPMADPAVAHPADWTAVQMVRLADPLDPAAERVVYLARRAGGSSFGNDKSHYVTYTRDANADQWIDRGFFADSDPGKLGTSNTGYGPNLQGTVCRNGSKLASEDRFPRDGVTVTTANYQWYASGRWMVRSLKVREAGAEGAADWTERPDLIDRWKGRAFQQSPDSAVSVVGFEDEQVNWEANSALLGERCGPVRCMREIWGADSGTNVTKTETFYRDAITYRYRVRVHPIPPDGLYTSWDYNRATMVGPKAEGQEGRYFTTLRPQGVPIDGVNDDVGQMDAFMTFPAFFDAADPTFNLPLAFDNWEQISGKDDAGSLVYTFELKGPTSLLTPLVVPYYRDDACLDDGTGDDPVQRPWPGDSYDDAPVQQSYRDLDGDGAVECHERQGAHAAHGIHFFATGDVDNAFLLGKPINEVDGQQWQFIVPTDRPKNVAEPYANVVRAPLQATVVPLTPPAMETSSADERGLMQVIGDLVAAAGDAIGEALAQDAEAAFAAMQDGLASAAAGLSGLLVDNPNASAAALATDVAGTPGDARADAQDGLGWLIGGFDAPGRVRAGVAVVDMTPDVGYCSGQYCDGQDDTAAAFDLVPELGGNDGVDPFLTAKTKQKSYGVQSRLTARAIVVEGANGKRIALLKTDNYLAQDSLIRRVAQILEQGQSGIGYDQILHHVTHNHSSSYSSTPSWGVWVFEDAFDARFFENQARRMALAIEVAARNLKPARMGATTVQHKAYKGNVTRQQLADDGTPAGYPLEYGDHGVAVVRFDEVDDAGNFVAPLAVWMNWGEHPESLNGHDLHSADFLAALERFIDREIGAPLVFSQGDVGSAEGSGNKCEVLDDDGQPVRIPLLVSAFDDEGRPQCGNATLNAQARRLGVWRDWDHQGYVQTERNVRFLADAVIQGWQQIGAGNSQVPFSTDFVVDYRNAFVPGPLSHPYPSVSNCRTDPTMEGNTGAPVLGLPDCERDVPDHPAGAQLAMVRDLLEAEGFPVPDHYDFPGFTGVEENVRLKLQAFRLGEVLLASCACEAQVDLILNIESRADDVAGNIYDGFDWACLSPAHAADPAYAQACEIQKRYYDPADYTAVAPMRGSLADAAKVARMRAQVHNDARGWDAPENAVAANSEPADATKIWGNFTKEELSPQRGYKLVVGVGHAGDYNGYTVSYREYVALDHYRKALTAYGPHTADYMATRLVRMAGAMKGGPELALEPQDALAPADEARMVAQSTALGQSTAASYDAWQAALPMDVGPAVALAQPQAITQFSATTFAWRGGNTQVDNPVVRVQSLVDGAWRDFADMSGEVQTLVRWPLGLEGAGLAWTGQHAWEWVANFEAYQAASRRLASTPAGSYRFVVDGCINDGAAATLPNVEGRALSLLYAVAPDGLQRELEDLAGDGCAGGARRYHLKSQPFSVAAWTGGAKPRSYESEFDYIDDADNGRFCARCTFRPWAE